MQIVTDTDRNLFSLSAEVIEVERSIWAADDAGSVAIGIAMTNQSAYVAQFPFLCMTDLGLNVEPAPGWQVEKIISNGRRLLRFSSEKKITLGFRDQTTACILDLKWRSQDGVLASIDAGDGFLPASSMQKLLCCMPGAANFPVERARLSIPLSLISAAVERSRLNRPAVADPLPLAAAG
jgi:hypothetical protein